MTYLRPFGPKVAEPRLKLHLFNSKSSALTCLAGIKYWKAYWNLSQKWIRDLLLAGDQSDFLHLFEPLSSYLFCVIVSVLSLLFYL